MTDPSVENLQSRVPESESTAAGNATEKIPATTEGIWIACSSLFLMAAVPIFIGSFRSVTYHKEQKVNLSDSLVTF